MQRVAALTGMRGLASLLVVGFHAVLTVWLAQMAFGWEADAFRHPVSVWLLGGGWIGVDFFFVLSGFLLARPLLRAGMEAGGGYRVFAAKRLLRIAPPYYASFLVVYLLAGWNHTSPFAPIFAVKPLDVLLHTLYLHNFFVDHQFAMNGVYWTLAVELQFYLLLPLMVLPFRRFGAKAALPFVAAAMLYAAWAHDPTDALRSRFLSFQLPAFLGHFAFGIAAAVLVERGWRSRVPPDAVIVLSLLTLVVVPAVALGYTRQFEPVDVPWYHIGLRPAAGLAFATLIVFGLQAGSRIGRAFTWRPLEWAGEVSYSLYLVHLPVAGLFLVTGSRDVFALGVPAFVLLLVAFSLAAAALLYVLVERPSLRLKDDVARRLQDRAEAPHA